MLACLIFHPPPARPRPMPVYLSVSPIQWMPEKYSPPFHIKALFRLKVDNQKAAFKPFSVDETWPDCRRGYLARFEIPVVGVLGSDNGIRIVLYDT